MIGKHRVQPAEEQFSPLGTLSPLVRKVLPRDSPPSLSFGIQPPQFLCRKFLGLGLTVDNFTRFVRGIFEKWDKVGLHGKKRSGC